MKDYEHIWAMVVLSLKLDYCEKEEKHTCTRVLIVSIGYRAASTTRPANPPATRHSTKQHLIRLNWYFYKQSH